MAKGACVVGFDRADDVADTFDQAGWSGDVVDVTDAEAQRFGRGARASSGSAESTSPCCVPGSSVPKRGPSRSYDGSVWGAT